MTIHRKSRGFEKQAEVASIFGLDVFWTPFFHGQGPCLPAGNALGKGTEPGRGQSGLPQPVRNEINLFIFSLFILMISELS